MVNTCSVCGTSESVQLVYDAFSEEGKWKCFGCINLNFPEGARIVRFTDKSHPLRPSYYLPVENEEDLELVLVMGERARRMGVKGFEACFYTAHKRERHIGPITFDMGSKNSNVMLRGHVDKLRLWMETSQTFPQVEQEREDMQKYMTCREQILQF
ncbi:MAG: hypothetical protein ACFE7R_07235 [Candidatus Hodarchaeota archaeon]